MRPYMTEDEAKLKWCPMRMAGASVPVNAGMRAAPSIVCVASRCMWWGWLERRGNDLDNGVPNPYLDKKLGRCEAPGGAK